LSVIFALLGLRMRPLWHKTLSTGDYIAGTQYNRENRTVASGDSIQVCQSLSCRPTLRRAAVDIM